MKGTLFLFFLGASILLGTGLYVLDISQDQQEVTYSAEVFKSPSCSCCTGYVRVLEEKGWKVRSTNTEAVDAVKDTHNIPAEMRSCHTTIIGKYFIEGHVPLKAVSKLLEENPDIDGIALPGMPIGTPGMPGPKEAPFIIYQLKDGVYSEFMRI